MKKVVNFAIVVMLFCINNYNALAQTNGDFRTIASGNFSDFTIWETYNSGWAAAVAAPTGQVPLPLALHIL